MLDTERTLQGSAGSGDGLYKHYEYVRWTLLDLVAGLPEEAFLNKEIGSRLVDDVFGHYDEHPIME